MLSQTQARTLGSTVAALFSTRALLATVAPVIAHPACTVLAQVKPFFVWVYSSCSISGLNSAGPRVASAHAVSHMVVALTFSFLNCQRWEPVTTDHRPVAPHGKQGAAMRMRHLRPAFVEQPRQPRSGHASSQGTVVPRQPRAAGRAARSPP